MIFPNVSHTIPYEYPAPTGYLCGRPTKEMGVKDQWVGGSENLETPGFNFKALSQIQIDAVVARLKSVFCSLVSFLSVLVSAQ